MGDSCHQVTVEGIQEKLKAFLEPGPPEKP